ncbi:NERD domain-containing protein [Sinorhizobium meliloti]|uniref:NERD domain-containing protein n=1 Tax=Rhizobium meliloti TaxID=382 RepID=UPI00299EB26F|nr:NERD domain-containing protein [Sinorhizobium meliloti]MDW9620961.1 NERD domain-containing protein [Sinorhizobium meliloti]MDX0154715.1 NERD domain-containing protein [Sinorhizobium meliloti]MDX0177647.1 NERD domain-containing protein [Sinorhizobium meliloti]
MAELINTPSQPKLKEDIVKKSLKSFNWVTLQKHLDTLDIEDDTVAELLGNIRRTTEFLLKRPDTKRETLRAEFVEKLAAYLSSKAGVAAGGNLRDLLQTIAEIEAGYAEILRTLSATAASKMLPETQVSAALVRSASAFHELMAAMQSESKRRKVLTLQSFRLHRADGSEYSPDAVVSSITNISTMTLMLLGHQNKWFDPNGYLVIPALTNVTDEEVYRAGLTELLAASWRQWERMEQRCRYFEGELLIHHGDHLPEWAPKGANKAVEYLHISEGERFDYLANERLNDRLVQTFQEMSMQINMETSALGIAGPVSLPPKTFVSAQEAHSGVSLSEILGYSIVSDHNRTCGLRLVEWIRGYATLRCLSEERYQRDGRNGLCFSIDRAELHTILNRVGLKNGTADIFIDEASLRMSSRDLFDQPLIRMHGGSLHVFGPSLLTADPARLTLSSIGNRGAQLERKGKAFENDMLRFFKERGFDAKALKFTRDGREFEYDVLVPWDDHLFLFECKNRSLSGHNPVAAYNFTQNVVSAIEQVTRLTEGLKLNADVVLDRTGIDVTTKIIVPCILNSLPYAMTGDFDGTFVTDASGIRRFFQGRHVNIVAPHRWDQKITVLHRTAMKSIWSADEPTPTDLVAFLASPVALQILSGHLEVAHHIFGLGERSVVSVADLTHAEITPSSIARLFDVDEEWVARESKMVTSALQRERRKRQERMVRDADRAWRNSRTKSGGNKTSE